MRFTIGLVILVAMPAAALAETAYVTDNLRLGLHQAEDTSGKAFRTLESGQAVEILSRGRNYAHVQLPDGVQGYLKAAYLVFEKPAKLIVAETQAENEDLARQLEDTKRAFAAPAAAIAALEQELAETTDRVRVLCCGPEPMMECVAEICSRVGVACEVSLETPMACGIGICFSCVARVRQADGSWDYKRTCVDGPVFDAEKLVW